MSKQGIDVLIATYNGSRTWPTMLEALARQQPTRRRLRYLVVDNASSDETPALLRAWADRLPIQLELCPEPGKMAALQHGARLLDGDLTVMTDDDIVPAPHWLAAYEAAADAHPEAALFGGPITPTPFEPLDPWYGVVDGFRHVLFALSDEPEGAVDAVASVYGPNYMMRTDAARAVLLERSKLGPTRGSSFPLGDETQLIQKIRARGGAFWYVREAGVGHLVRQPYTTLEYMLKRAQRHGRGMVILEAKGAHDLGLRLGKAAVCGARALKLSVTTAGLDRTRPDPATFRALYNLNWNWGAVKGAVLGPY
jgi:hypothetical protein